MVNSSRRRDGRALRVRDDSDGVDVGHVDDDEDMVMFGMGGVWSISGGYVADRTRTYLRKADERARKNGGCENCALIEWSYLNTVPDVVVVIFEVHCQNTET